MAEQDQPQPEILEYLRLRIFKIKQAELGARPPAHVERKQIYEYEFICDINGPCPERSESFEHFSSYFKIQFRGENLLKGIVPNSLRVIDPSVTDHGGQSRHYVHMQANLMDSQLFITADFDLSERQPNVSQLQIHFKIVLHDKLDLNLMRMQKAQVMQQAHCFDLYHRNGTPPTVNQLTHGTNPYEDEEADFDRITNEFNAHVQGMGNQINHIAPMVPPQVGGSSEVPPGQATRHTDMDDLEAQMIRLQLSALANVTTDESTKPRPAYVGGNVMIRIEINKLPSITVACDPAQTTVYDLLHKLRNLVYEERLHFPEVDITNDTCDTLRLHHDNHHVSNTNQTIGELFNGKDLNKIQFMVLVWNDPVLNAQVAQNDAQFNENDLDNRAKVVRRFMEQMIILMRNVDACLANIKHGRAPPERIRYNHAAKKTGEDLRAPDLGRLVKEMARVVRDLGTALSQLAHVCSKDERYFGDEDAKLVRAKSIVQNVMDSLRYFAPAANSLSRMVVPLDDSERPRMLYVLQPQAAHPPQGRNRPPA